MARLIGFDQIPVKQQTAMLYDTHQNPDELLHQIIRQEARESGFYEVLTNSMVAHAEVKDFSDGDFVKILNPISDDMNIMRRSLIPGLLKVICYNINRHAPNLRLYEMGRVFVNSDPQTENAQPYYISGLIHGTQKIPDWSDSSETC